MSTNYRDQPQFPSSSEEESTPSSSSSGEESQVVQDVLSSPSSNYWILSFLGEGGFGEVVKCVKAATRETVAVKIMKKSDITPEAQNELAILQQLRAFDPDRFNFVRFNDVFLDREHICLEFEMLDVTLWDFLERKPSRSLSVKEIRPILHQVATTLELLRSLGVVHADLKPDNIMMVDCANQPLKIKMIDFGLARNVSQTEWGSYLQPRYYRSPEVILGHPLTTAIDMWSLGCIAAELFLGFVLYPGECEYTMLQHMVQTQGPLPQQILNKGLKTTWFFQKKRCRRRRRWRLKTPGEYGQAMWTESYFNSLDDLKKTRPVCHLSEEDTMAESEDQDNFVDLLKRMLHLDVTKRITPSQLREDPFIAMNDLAENFPHSFYVKSCCEVMEVCQDQQPWLNPQASTSTANVSCQVPPAWHNRQEHPLILGIASAVSSCLSIHEDQRPSEPRQLSFPVGEKRTQPKLQLPVTSEKSQAFREPESKMSRDSSEGSRRGDRSPDSVSPERKRRRRNPEDVQTLKELPQNSEEAPAEATSSTAEVKPQRKRTWDTFIASHRGLRSPSSGSPERKKRKSALVLDSKEAPTEAPSDEGKPRVGRKRMWATFNASHRGDRSPDSSSPERKKRKMSREDEDVLSGGAEEAPATVAQSQRRRRVSGEDAEKDDRRDSSNPEEEEEEVEDEPG